MAWVPFQKSNWTRTTSSEHARQYFTNVASSIVITAASSQLLTLTNASFMFQGNGIIDVAFPEGASGGATAAAQGLVLGSAYLLQTGIQANGVHPSIVCQISSQTLMTVAATGINLVAVQF
jgi:hypothetical protein